MEYWAPLESYQGYSVSNLGRIKNDRREKVLAVARTQAGLTYTCLMQDGVQVKRAVAKLVAEAFVPNSRPEFTTPIHLDGDLKNCYASNLLWRPRWFALKFTRQFRVPLPSLTHQIRERETGDIFETPWPPVSIFGLLYMDILLGIHNHTPVFPTWQSFEEVW